MIHNKYAIKPGSRVWVKYPGNPELTELVFMQTQEDILHLFELGDFNRWTDNNPDGVNWKPDLVGIHAIKMCVGSGYTIEKIEI